MHLLSQREHHEGCTDKRCVAKCDVAAFHRALEEPLLLSEARKAEVVQRRLEALVHGDIPA